MKLPRNFDPASAASAAGARSSSWHKLGDGPWSGTVMFGLNGTGRELEIQELATGWIVIDVYAGRELKGRDLEQLLRKALR